MDTVQLLLSREEVLEIANDSIFLAVNYLDAAAKEETEDPASCLRSAQSCISVFDKIELAFPEIVEDEGFFSGGELLKVRLRLKKRRAI